MARFILIDNSLEAVGGHHYQYARDVLEAAAGRGMEGVLVTHCRFRRHNDLPSDWQVLPWFRFSGYSRHALCLGGGADGPVDEQGAPLDKEGDAAPQSDGWVARWRRHRRQWSRARYLESYEQTLARAFRRLGIFHDDLIFFSTTSDFDLLGLVRYLRSDPRTQIPTWQLQFHFNLLEGRDPDYEAQQEQLAAARRQMGYALSLIPNHRVRFYSTTAPLARQYERLELGNFTELPYPAGPVFVPPAATRAVGPPYQIACAGHLRREKGKAALQEVVERFDAQPWADQVRLRAQMARLPRWLRKQPPQHLQVDRVRHPLTTAKFVEFVRQSDIGLFLYDSRRYAARCSGILVEMLSCGVPVIVPAGSWLAEQIVPAQQLWTARVAKQARGGASETLLLEEGQWQRNWPGDARQMLVEIGAAKAFCPGRYAVLTVRQQGEDTPQRHVFRCEQEPSRLLIDRRGASGQLELQLSGAFGQPLPPIERLRVCYVPSAGEPPLPHSAVGLIAADVGQLPALTTDIINHFDHYRRSAAAFAESWRRLHSPLAVVQRLTAELDRDWSEQRHAA